MHYGKNLTGNERFFGFCVDILARVANEVGFDYILDLVPDKKYGAKDSSTGEWNGMVLQLMKHVSNFYFSLVCFIVSLNAQIIFLFCNYYFKNINFY